MNPETPQKLWFRRKHYGYGWYPLTWQGWAVIAVYVVVVSPLGVFLGDETSAWQVIFQFVVPMLIATAVLLWVCYRTGETPRWQWGKRDDDR